ncbi:hypothetical protein IP69_03300 [Bosea sp. AAP35]|uniref:hypothetical protein n=1 Tax=Bosea sp. AAP35 TaxID=1523417 RepID=UPI0006B95BA3|nr:hypothetical protein [Bosea sp. AAP35]KPF72878.1 hypothetical protein IP69_03300 [Bosea sp. AAP35]
MTTLPAKTDRKTNDEAASDRLLRLNAFRSNRMDIDPRIELSHMTLGDRAAGPRNGEIMAEA